MDDEYALLRNAESLTMTQETVILELLRDGPKTTNDLCTFHAVTPDGKHISLARELTRITSTLRKKGYDIRYTHGKGGTGVYTLWSEPPRVLPGGQLVLAI